MGFSFSRDLKISYDRPHVWPKSYHGDAKWESARRVLPYHWKHFVKIFRRSFEKEKSRGEHLASRDFV